MTKIVEHELRDGPEIDDEIVDTAARRALSRWSRHVASAEQFAAEMERSQKRRQQNG